MYIATLFLLPPVYPPVQFGWQSHSSFPSYAEIITPTDWNYWSHAVSRRYTHPSQPPQMILFKNVGQVGGKHRSTGD